MALMSARARLALVLPASVIALVGCGDSNADDQTPTSSTTKHHHAGDKQTDSADTSDDPGSTQVTVPVYFVGDTPQGKRLYREFRKVDGDDSAGAALTLAASDDAL